MSGLLLAMFTLTNSQQTSHIHQVFLIRVFFKKILFSISQRNSAASAENFGIFGAVHRDICTVVVTYQRKEGRRREMGAWLARWN
jgi:hypothetical protein